MQKWKKQLEKNNHLNLKNLCQYNKTHQASANIYIYIYIHTIL